MNLRNSLRTLAAAAMLALGLLSTPVLQGHVHAEGHNSQSSCNQAGYYWSDEHGCADKQCWSGGTYYEGGETRATYDQDGNLQSMYICDGFTGGWEQIYLVALPTLPRTTTIAFPECPRPTE